MHTIRLDAEVSFVGRANQLLFASTICDDIHTQTHTIWYIYTEEDKPNNYIEAKLQKFLLAQKRLTMCIVVLKWL